MLSFYELATTYLRMLLCWLDQGLAAGTLEFFLRYESLENSAVTKSRGNFPYNKFW